MRIGNWLLTGNDAAYKIALAGQCRSAMSRSERQKNVIAALRKQMDDLKYNHDENLKEKEELKDILQELNPERYALWKASVSSRRKTRKQ